MSLNRADLNKGMHILKFLVPDLNHQKLNKQNLTCKNSEKECVVKNSHIDVAPIA